MRTRVMSSSSRRSASSSTTRMRGAVIGRPLYRLSWQGLFAGKRERLGERDDEAPGGFAQAEVAGVDAVFIIEHGAIIQAQLARQVQAQAGALAGRRIKRLEQMGPHFGRDAGTVVLHVQLQPAR